MTHIKGTGENSERNSKKGSLLLGIINVGCIAAGAIFTGFLGMKIGYDWACEREYNKGYNKAKRKFAVVSMHPVEDINKDGYFDFVIISPSGEKRILVSDNLTNGFIPYEEYTKRELPYAIKELEGN